jgi:UDP-N-acetylglucosamine acyltransferase
MTAIDAGARVASDATIGQDVAIGPGCMIGPHVAIGDGCRLIANVHVTGHTTIGARSVIYPFVSLGTPPQSARYRGGATRLVIGAGCDLREGVTMNIGTEDGGGVTTVGERGFFMANSHVAHDCVIGNNCVLANGALVAGHCVLQDSVILSGNTAVHQFVRLGRLSMLSGVSATGKDIPPFVIQQGHDTISGINLVGMKRSGMSHPQINAVRAAFKMLFREGLVLPAAMAKMEKDLGQVDVVQEMLTFLRGCRKGINFMRNRFHEDLAA